MKATGQLIHHFWGTYSCEIYLDFECPEHAVACKEQKLPTWKLLDSTLGKSLSNEQLTEFMRVLNTWHLEIIPCGRRDCKGQCRNAGIDSLNHSIDVGPIWTCDIPAIPLNQMVLL